MPPTITLVPRPAQTLHGLAMPSADKTIARDIPALTAAFHRAGGTAPGSVLPFYVVTSGYRPQDGTFTLFIGGEAPHPALQALALPSGEWGHIAVRPRLGFLWGPAIGQAKRYFYTRWLPASGRQARSIEVEHHTAQSTGKRPHIDLYFALTPKEDT